jgi:tetratricopeptide (TPR) repeat protein
VKPLAIVLGLAVGAAQAGPTRGLTGTPQLARVYDAIFDAQFDQVPAELARACPPSPKEICIVLQAVSLWWQIQLDPHSRALDHEFEQKVNSAISIAEAWVKREPQRAEAWFYVGGAYGARVQWRVLRAEGVAAARDGKRIKDALERALELDPGMHDAWFGIGLYHYYADVAPAAARVLRWLLFLPGGDRVKGLQEMLRARNHGALLRSEADYQMHVLYLWYEEQPERALEILESLRLRHSHNPHFPQLIAEVQDVYQHDLTASLRSWRALFTAARQQKVSMPAMAEARARLGMALQLDRLFETDAAIEHLRAVIADNPTAPYGAMAQAQLQLGEALDRLGQRDEAIAAYQATLAAATADDPLELRERAREGLRRVPDAQETTAYRRSIDGWRALEQGDLAAAEAAINESIALRPRDPVTRYRQARLLQTQKADARAMTVLEAIIASRASTPPTIYAFACVDAARLFEQRGERARAIERYRIARDVFGADQRTKETAERALTRLQSSSPRVQR